MQGIKRPTFFLLILLVSGRALGTFLPAPSWLILCCLVFLVISQSFSCIRKRDAHTPPPNGSLLFLAVLFIGVYQQIILRENEQSIENAVRRISELPSIAINARIESECERKYNSIRVIIGDIRIVSGEKSEPLDTKALAYFSSDAARKMLSHDPAPGDLIKIESRAMTPRSLRNPTLFNYRAFLAQKGIHLIFRIRSDKEFETSLPDGKRSIRNSMFHAIHKIRLECERNFERVMTENDAALIKGLCLGSSYDMNEHDREIFLNTGLIHLFSVSGLHTCMIALFFYFLLRLLGLRFSHVSFLTIGGIWFFAILTGLRMPVIRSALMITCLLGSHFLPGRKRPIEGLSSLSFVAFWILVFNPRTLFQPDFLLSYLSVFAIFLFMPFFRKHFIPEPDRSKIKFPFVYGFIQYVLTAMFTVLSVQIVLLPVFALYYHKVSLVSIIASPFAIPLSYVTLVLGLGHSVLAMAIPELAPFTGWTLIQPIHVLRMTVGIFSRIPFSAITIQPLPWFFWGIYYGFIFGGNWALERKEWIPDRAVRFSVTFLILIALLIWFPILGTPRYDLEVFFLDVGQGDAIYMEFSDRGNLLIDGGLNEPRNMGKDVITPFLENRGNDSIDAIILTHPDADHLGGLPFILDHFFVRYAFEAGEGVSTPLYREWDEKLKDWGVERVKVCRGDRIEGFEGADISILHPPEPVPENLSQNDRSVVVRLKTGEFVFLFTGDASRDAELSMVASGVDLDADILKVGHHGSGDASENIFLQKVSPRISVISVGEGNRHGHPHRETLKSLEKYSEKIFRTDRNGAVTIRIKKDNIFVECQDAE
ncbi:DNA internalization-related competence protein ComEC/Rec2 [Candidatus Sumerlaeota bacterium]|nr:DNA internalization-related competence protein ComEC/Rec2 [Candidatus Sumerlaeota bacterium]